MSGDRTQGQRRDCDARGDDAQGNGFVYLVGAGPGDPELLTLKAVKALKRADVILCDDLVSDEVLEHARPDARVVHVGKRGGCKSTPQEFIERLMVAEARAGRIVVRLKGGDPMVFGRGGEECAALRRAGIAHEVVNGITAGLAAASALGIPLTHREHCHGAIFVTGHGREGSATDWAALVRTGLPLVVYMGVARGARIAGELLAAGMRPTMPVAAVANATRRDQREVVTTLAELPAALAAGAIRSPAVLVVGEVAGLARECSSWPTENFHDSSTIPGARAFMLG
jgi:uroporphyrin-III C-methyltransferase